MPTPLEDIDREKELSELTDDEKQVIRDNVDDLSDEDKEVFKTVLEEEEEEDAPLSFKDEDELNAYLDKREKAKAEEAKKAELEEEEAKKQFPFFEDGKLPKNWNDAFNKAYPKFIERQQKEQQESLEKRNAEIKKLNEKFDAEVEVLRKTDDSIPEKGTDERAEYDSELSKIAVQYNQTTMTGAYKIKKGLDAVKELEGNKEEEEEEEEGDIEGNQNLKGKPPLKKKVPLSQKRTARRIGKSGGVKGSGAKKYRDVAGKTMDEIMDEEDIE